MIKNNELQAFFSYFLCAVVYFVVLGSNVTFLSFHLDNYNLSFNEYNAMSRYIISSYIVPSVLLLLFSNFISLRIWLLLGLALYTFSMVFIFLNNISITPDLFYFSLYSTGNILIAYTIFINLFLDSNISSTVTMICICLAGLASFFIIKIILFILTDNIIYHGTNNLTELTAANIFLFIVFGLFVLKMDFFKRNIVTDDRDFLNIVKNSEAEILCGFSVFYIFRIIIEEYGNYSLRDAVLTVVEASTGSYIISPAVLFACLLIIYIKKININSVNIIIIIVLLSLFITFPLWAEDEIFNIIIRFIIGILLAIIMLCNVLAITRKFEESNLIIATQIYMLGCTSGYYCGFIISNNLQEITRKNSFLPLVCFVLFNLSAYYIYFFKRYKLWQWKN